ncbi:WD repeat-containing protein 43 [Condylostylus longicornis]|uniref:WD repeat-containing protein 43 n=1 Tax=Condylostylus longicornis TaxID=2530218 RepID=UPI00244E25EA|nr:WD repeat-containing protein 43 [Condylostylus longicornis]
MMSTNTISEYSSDGKLFALINEHGILKIWDTETNVLKQEYAPNFHLSGPSTCLKWLSISQNVKTKKSKKLKTTANENLEKSDESLYIAFGTINGGVVLYSYSLGEVERSLIGEGHTGKVTCIAFDNHDILYTGGEDCHIICWSLSNEKRIASWKVGNEKLNSLAYLSESKNIVIGTRQLKIFSPEKQEIIYTHIGHTSDILLLETFTYGLTDFCLSAAKTERIINLWTLKSKNKYRNSTATLLMEDIAYCLSYKFENEQTLKVSVVTRSGVIHIYCIDMENLKPDKPIKPSTTIQIASDSQTNIEPIMAITASLKFGSKKKELLFGYGDKQFLQFEKITINFAEHIQVLIRSQPKKPSKTNKQATEAVSKTVIPKVGTASYQTASTPIIRKKRDDVQIPLETRLQNLHVTNGEMPNAQSKVQLLIQALHSKDSNLLYSVLSTEDQKVINLTLQKLPVQYVSSLVNELTLLMEKKHVNVQISSNWLKALIKIHSSQLMALGSEDLLAKFGPCIGIIEHRASCLNDLSKLNGRLQLLVSQIKRNVEEDVLTNENCLVYEDESDESLDLENNIPDNNTSLSDDGDWEANENDQMHQSENEQDDNEDEDMSSS